MEFSAPTPSGALAPAAMLKPHEALFARRAARLERLASGHADANWLTCLATLARQQQQLLESQGSAIAAAMSASRSAVNLQGREEELKPLWQSLYRTLHAAMAGSALAPQGEEPMAGDALEKAGDTCLQLARGEIVAGTRDNHDFLVAAAMQVAWSAAARALPAQTTPQNEQHTAHQHCPACGCEPVGSVVMAGEGKAGLRYLECSLCATRWHAVRAHCTLCDEGGVISYLGLEDGNAAIQAECCEHCHGYVKTYFQEKDPEVDPVADDLASLMLDVLVGQEGYSRASPNLFLAGVEPIDHAG